MGLERMVEKAERLVRQGRVIYLGSGRYNVTGDHGTYLIQQLPDGRFTCTCQGFRDRRVCSHVAAVIILREVRGVK